MRSVPETVTAFDAALKSMLHPPAKIAAPPPTAVPRNIRRVTPLSRDSCCALAELSSMARKVRPGKRLSTLVVECAGRAGPPGRPNENNAVDVKKLVEMCDSSEEFQP
jgi:hypothetical protein